MIKELKLTWGGLFKVIPNSNKYYRLFSPSISYNFFGNTFISFLISKISGYKELCRPRCILSLSRKYPKDAIILIDLAYISSKVIKRSEFLFRKEYHDYKRIKNEKFDPWNISNGNVIAVKTVLLYHFQCVAFAGSKLLLRLTRGFKFYTSYDAPINYLGKTLADVWILSKTRSRICEFLS